MSVWTRLVDWFLGPEEDEGEPSPADGSPPAGGPPAGEPRAKRPPLPDDSDSDDPDTLTPALEEALTERYGAEPAAVWDNPATEAAVRRITRYDVAEPGHHVFVTRGLRHWRRPHELILRLRAAPVAEGEVRAPPEWPLWVLAALGELTRTRDHTIALGERIRELEVEGGDVPYRYFVVVPDPELEWIEDPWQPEVGLAFVQVVPLTEARLAEMDAAGEEAASPVLAAWCAEDRLLLVS